ncbi:MAG TPA: PaaX family transcriptional regulator [Oceanospirillales bacterium]|nr:PaaX family transcriptional regulator [Oceanospirillaceae bacterium]HBS41389.1 PaaX family transcriptional regulator [Oceanospirillales bacterium]|tara:strand:- start:266 stop:1066 length:801 start_codon:yes stop_codon:yes gene_type:complete
MTEKVPSYPARKLILNLVKEAEEPMAAQTLLRIADLFGIEANNVRVTLNRLVKEDLLKLTDRGVYELGVKARSLAAAQERWRVLEEELVPWEGHWYVLHVAHLGRRNRKQVRQRERAMDLRGFRALQQGLLVRPQNLACSAAQLKQSLCDLGLESGAVLMSSVTFQLDDAPDAALWAPQALTDNYRRQTVEMISWLGGYHLIPLEQAARESFLIGDQVLHTLAYDPRLPEELVDTTARRRLVETMKTFDDVGNRIWSDLIASIAGD